MDEATANMLAELRLAGINFATDDQLMQAGVLHPAGAIPQTAFGMPDLSILRGQGATPGIPLQHESVAQLPPWAAVARSLTPIGGVDVELAISPRRSKRAITGVAPPPLAKVWPSVGWAASLALAMVHSLVPCRCLLERQPRHNKRRQHRLTMVSPPSSAADVYNSTSNYNATGCRGRPPEASRPGAGTGHHR
jgi:hypothetical protein